MGEKYNWITWIVIVGLIYGGYSLFTDNETSESSYTPSTYNTASALNAYDSSGDYNKDYDSDGYAWAEDNDVSSFDECQNQFGTSYEEDECNRYVKENYTGYNNFNGYECTEDCSGHEAGYAWAEENYIDDEYDCDGNSDSFNEGCLSYVEENY